MRVEWYCLFDGRSLDKNSADKTFYCATCGKWWTFEQLADFADDGELSINEREAK